MAKKKRTEAQIAGVEKAKKTKVKNAVILTTTDECPGYKITKIFGLASISGYLNDRTEAKLREQAVCKGGNAVISIQDVQYSKHNSISRNQVVGTIVSVEPA